MRKVILTILDGYGYSEENLGNATRLANTKTLDKIFKEYPTTFIKSSGLDVGLPSGQMGNSEVGHMNIGAGRIIYQDLTRINKDIETKTFFHNETLIKTIMYAKNNHQKLHLLGLLSDGGVHSHIAHLFAILDLCHILEFKDVYVHAILDGRDTMPKSGITYLEKLIKKLDDLKFPSVATVIGRIYAMDRDNRYDRIKVSYDLMVNGIGEKTNNLLETIQEKYYNNETDEFIKPILINSDGLISQKDAFVFYNFRPDRAREITKSLVLKDFSFFSTKELNLYYTCMTNYDETITGVNIVYPKEVIKNTLGEIISKNNLKQLRIAETEKYAHVTFFLNGGIEEKFNLENRILIPSPKDVQTYDLKPEMSANLVCQEVIKEIEKNYYDLIVLNFANPDMVGHTGNLDATIKALEYVDECLEKILSKVIEYDYVMILTADHGNSEKMLNEDLSVNTNHTNNPVLLSLINYGNVKLKDGKLSDISPTILDILNINKPEEMTGETLIIN